MNEQQRPGWNPVKVDGLNIQAETTLHGTKKSALWLQISQVLLFRAQVLKLGPQLTDPGDQQQDA